MTRERAENYQNILKRLESLTVYTMDTVKGSSDEFPFTQHTIAIRGIPSSPSANRQRRALEQELARIEAFGRALPYRQSQVFYLRVIEGLPWKEVAERLDFQISSDGARMLYQRSFIIKLDK